MQNLEIRRRRRQGDALRTSAETLGPMVGPVLTELFQPHLRDDEQMPPWETVIDVPVRYVDGLGEELFVRSSLHLNEVDSRADQSGRRTLATRGVVSYLQKLKAGFEFAYGPLSYSLVGVLSRLPYDPYLMADLGPRVVANLRTFEPPETTTPLDLPTLTAELEAVVQELLDSIEGHDADRRDTEVTVVAKDEALEAYDDARRQVVRLVVALYQLAGLGEHARRLRRSLRRRSRVEEAQTPVEPQTAAEPQPAEETP